MTVADLVAACEAALAEEARLEHTLDTELLAPAAQRAVRAELEVARSRSLSLNVAHNLANNAVARLAEETPWHAWLSQLDSVLAAREQTLPDPDALVDRYAAAEARRQRERIAADRTLLQFGAGRDATVSPALTELLAAEPHGLVRQLFDGRPGLSRTKARLKELRAQRVAALADAARLIGEPVEAARVDVPQDVSV